MKRSKIFLGICILGFLACAVWLVYYYISNQKAQQAVEDMKVTYVEAIPLETSTPAPTVEPVETSAPEQTEVPITEPEYVLIDGKEYPDFTGLEVPDRKIDFAGLQAEENAHIYAWIYIPGTNVDYPVLQHPEDDEYYLNHDTTGKVVAAGSIFTQQYNSKDFNDNHTVIYGHNMKNGSMFKTLHYYEDETFFEENSYIYVYTESDTRVYEIYGAYEYSDVHLLLSYDCESKEGYEAYLEEIQGISETQGHFNRELELAGDDKIITLSTCIGGKETSRYLVQAKLIAVENEGNE